MVKKIGSTGPQNLFCMQVLIIVPRCAYVARTDQEYEGKAFPASDMDVGYLPQEPQLDPTKTVAENVLEGPCPPARSNPSTLACPDLDNDAQNLSLVLIGAHTD